MHSSVARRSALGLMVLLLATLLAPGRALAHSDLTTSDPADGDVLTTAPSTVTLTFNEALLPKGNAVTLTSVATGQRLEVGPVEVDGPTVAVAWPAQSPAGEFRLAYRVVSADGHPIEGAIRFTVEQAVGAGAALEPSSPTPEPVDGPSPTGTPDAASSTPNPVATAAADAERQATPGVLAWILGLGLVILVGAAAGTWVTRRTR